MANIFVLYKFLLRKFSWFLTLKIEFESTILALFDEPLGKARTNKLSSYLPLKAPAHTLSLVLSPDQVWDLFESIWIGLDQSIVFLNCGRLSDIFVVIKISYVVKHEVTKPILLTLAQLNFFCVFFFFGNKEQDRRISLLLQYLIFQASVKSSVISNCIWILPGSFALRTSYEFKYTNFLVSRILYDYSKYLLDSIVLQQETVWNKWKI